MANFYRDNDDLRYYIERGLDWGPLVEATEYGWRAPDAWADVDEAVEFYGEVLDLVGGFAAEEIAPHAAAIDRAGVEYRDGDVHFPEPLASVFDGIQELELHGLCVPRELGGQNAPVLVYFINAELMARADVSVMSHHSFYGGIAMAMLAWSIQEGTTEFEIAADGKSGHISKTRFEAAIREIAEGRAWGSMDLTEPDAGSDLAALRTVGEQAEDGSWTVTGQKVFITSGHGKYHIVIARTENSGDADDPFAGLGGLSTFLVPAWTGEGDDRTWLARVERIEEKLGHHGSPTCAIRFDKTPAQLIGQRGEGFRYMLTLMNNARLGVGFECIGLCEAALRASLDYAEQRRSMGKAIGRHEMIADWLEEMANDIQGLRALAMEAAWHEELSRKSELLAVHVWPQLPSEAQDALAEKGRSADDLRADAKKYARRSRRTTPLLKYLAAEKAVEMARRCVQIHGANGYTKDYPGEKLLRDSLVMPIYEGTSQIQALMAMKDALGAIIKAPQEFARRVAQAHWRARTAREPLTKRVAKIQSLSLAAQQHLIARTAAAKVRSLGDRPMTDWAGALKEDWDPKRDFSLAMLHAARLTQLLADVAIAEVLLRQTRRHADRADILERHLERAEPRVRHLHDVITTTGSRLVEALAADEDASSGGVPN